MLVDRPIDVAPGPGHLDVGLVDEPPVPDGVAARDTTGDPAIAAMHRQIQASSRGALLPLLELAPGSAGSGFDDALDVELAWETMRVVLQGLALWWYEHPDVPHERIVTTAMNSLWLGLERYLGGEKWRPT